MITPTWMHKEELTKVMSLNRLPHMGRKKTGYKAPEGLIKREGSPFWWIKLTHEGKLYRKSTEVPLENITKATIILREVQKGLLERSDKTKEILGNSIPFKELADRYLKEVSPEKRSGKSDEVNATYPKKYFGDRRIDNIRPIDIYSFRDWRKGQISERKKKPVSNATINRETAFISSCFQMAIQWGYVEKNPCREIKRFKEKKRTRYITDREFDAIKKQARENEKATHLPDIMDALYLTGLREGRILNLKWVQVDLDERFIKIEEGSGNKGVPERVWINDTLYGLLKRLKAKRTFNKVVSQYVFQKEDGSRYRSIKTAWKTSCKNAGVMDARIHDIRHKTATDLGDMGFTPAQIALVLGHSNTATTDGYTHLQSNRTALESLGKRR